MGAVCASAHSFFLAPTISGNFSYSFMNFHKYAIENVTNFKHPLFEIPNGVLPWMYKILNFHVFDF